MTDLQQLVNETIAKFNMLSNEQKAEHWAKQRDSFVRSEMSWPKPNFEMQTTSGVVTKAYASYEDYCNG